MAGLTLASRRTLSLTRSPSQKEASFVVPQWRTNLRDVHTYSQTLAIIGLHLIKKGHLFAAERIPRFFTKPDQRLTEGYPSECERVSREKVLGLDFFSRLSLDRDSNVDYARQEAKDNHACRQSPRGDFPLHESGIRVENPLHRRNPGKFGTSF